LKGKIKWYNSRKGYGFISGEDDKDVFVHNTDVPEDTVLNEEDEVEYEVEKTDKGLKAVNIEKL